MTAFMHIAHSLAFNLGYVLGVGLCPVGWQSMHSVSYAWHALLSADLAFTPIGPSLARLVGLVHQSMFPLVQV